MNCGVLKVGAFNDCPACGAEPVDDDIALQLTTHYLTEDELKRIGLAVSALRDLVPDEEIRFHAFAYFLSRKWPKILEYGIDEVEPELADILDTLYGEHLSRLPGQETDERLARPHWEYERWESASKAEFQAEEDHWNEQLLDEVLLRGVATGKKVVQLKIDLGEGTLVQRLKHRFRLLFSTLAYREFVMHTQQLVEEAREYERHVKRYRKAVRNGWSGRTKKRAEYLGGTYVRLLEMADSCRKLAEHKAGIAPIIPIEFQKIKQEFEFSHTTFVELCQVVLDPRKIPIE